MDISKRNAVRIVSFTVAVVGVLAVRNIQLMSSEKRALRSVSYTYSRAMGDLCDAVENVCSCSLAVTFLINNIILKNIIARTRPYEVVEGLNRIIGAQSDFSFPSGHSGASFAVAVVMFMEMPKKYGVPALIVATLIAFSRLYVGVHYPFDVIAGVLTGTIYAVITVAIYRKFFKDKKHSEK